MDPYFLFSLHHSWPSSGSLLTHLLLQVVSPDFCNLTHHPPHSPHDILLKQDYSQLKQASGAPHALSYKTQSTVLRPSRLAQTTFPTSPCLSPPHSASKTSATPDANRSLNTGQPWWPLDTCHVSHMEVGCLPTSLPTRLFLQITSRTTLSLKPYSIPYGRFSAFSLSSLLFYHITSLVTQQNQYSGHCLLCTASLSHTPQVPSTR